MSDNRRFVNIIWFIFWWLKNQYSSALFLRKSRSFIFAKINKSKINKKVNPEKTPKKHPAWNFRPTRSDPRDGPPAIILGLVGGRAWSRRWRRTPRGGSWRSLYVIPSNIPNRSFRLLISRTSLAYERNEHSEQNFPSSDLTNFTCLRAKTSLSPIIRTLRASRWPCPSASA